MGISPYKEQIGKAKLINQTAAFKQAMRRGKIERSEIHGTVIEGVITHLRSLGLKIRTCGLEKVNIQGIISALALNVLKAVKKMKEWSKAQATLCITPSSFGFIPKFLELIQFFREPTQSPPWSRLWRDKSGINWAITIMPLLKLKRISWLYYLSFINRASDQIRLRKLPHQKSCKRAEGAN